MNRPLSRIGLLVVTSAALLLIAGAGVAAKQAGGGGDGERTMHTNSTMPTTITAAGEGRVTRSPDRAVVSLGTVVSDPTSAGAQNKLNLKVDAVTKAIKSLNLPGLVIQTQWISMNPEYDYNNQRNNQPRLIGYQASTTLRVQVSDPAKAGAIIDAGIDAGSNQVQGISFELADDKPAQSEALKLAAADARRQADAMAEALGLRITRVLTATTGVASAPPRPFESGGMMLKAARADGGMPTPIETGEIQVNAQATVTFVAEAR